MSNDDEQCARRPDGTLKESDEIVWFNDPDDTVPIPTSASGLGAPSVPNGPTIASPKGKEPSEHTVLRGPRRIKPTAKAQQSSLTGFFSTRTVVSEYPSALVPFPFIFSLSSVNGKESAQNSSTDLNDSRTDRSGPKQGGKYDTLGMSENANGVRSPLPQWLEGLKSA